MTNPYDIDLDKNPANYQQLTPITYLERAAKVFPEHVAIIHGSQRIAYRTFWRRALKLASALSKHGVGKGDTVTVMLSNTPPMLEAHFGVPMVKAVLHCLNTRLDAAIVAFQLDHAETKVLIVDREFSGVVRQALAGARVKPLVIDYDDPDYGEDAPTPRASASAASTTRISSPAATRISPGRCPTTNGTRSRSTIPPAPPATPRAWSTIIAVPP